MANTVNPILTSNKDGEDTVWAFRISQASSGGSGVSRIVAGTNVTVSPPGGTGVVTVNSSGGGGSGTVTSVTAGSSNIVIGGTPTVAPTVNLSTTPSVNSLTTPLIANAAGTITLNPASTASSVNLNGTVITLSAPLGATLGDTSTRLLTENIDANSNKIFLTDTREFGGSDWTTVGTRFGQIIDSVAPKGYLQFGGYNKAGSIGLGTAVYPSALIIYEGGPALFGVNLDMGGNQIYASIITTTKASSNYTPLTWNNTLGSGFLAAAAGTLAYSDSAVPGDTVLSASGKLILQNGSGVPAGALIVDTSNNVTISNKLNGHELYVYGTFLVPAISITTLSTSAATVIPFSQTSVGNGCSLNAGVGPEFSMTKNGAYRFIMNFTVLNTGALAATFNVFLYNIATASDVTDSIRIYTIAGAANTTFTYSTTIPSYVAGQRIQAMIYIFTSGATLRLQSGGVANYPTADLNIELMG